MQKGVKLWLPMASAGYGDHLKKVFSLNKNASLKSYGVIYILR